MTDQPQNLVALAEWKASCFVCASARNPKTGKFEPIGFEFSNRFRGHPWVEASIREGWDKELRSHLRFTVKRRILEGKPFEMIEALMPNKEWADAARKQAKRFALAKEDRDKQSPPAGAANLERITSRLLKKASTSEAAE